MTSPATPPAAAPTEEDMALAAALMSSNWFDDIVSRVAFREALALAARQFATARTSAALEEPMPAHALEAARASLVADGAKNLSASDVERALGAAIRALKGT